MPRNQKEALAFVGNNPEYRAIIAFNWDDQKNQLEATTYLQAPGRGDEILAEVMQKIQNYASAQNLPVTHMMVAEHEGALVLIERTGGYEFFGDSEDGFRIYKKVFEP